MIPGWKKNAGYEEYCDQREKSCYHGHYPLCVLHSIRLSIPGHQENIGVIRAFEQVSSMKVSAIAEGSVE
jgi:hypothetical protein